MNVGPGRAVTIIFEPDTSKYDRLDVDEVELVNGGVMHKDADGNIRWHPAHRIKMVVTR